MNNAWESQFTIAMEQLQESVFFEQQSAPLSRTEKWLSQKNENCIIHVLPKVPPPIKIQFNLT